MFTAPSPAGNGSAILQFSSSRNACVIQTHLYFSLFSFMMGFHFPALAPLSQSRVTPVPQGNSPSPGMCWVLHAPGALRAVGPLGSGQDRAECDPTQGPSLLLGLGTPRTGKGQSHPSVGSEWRRGDTAGWLWALLTFLAPVLVLFGFA